MSLPAAGPWADGGDSWAGQVPVTVYVHVYERAVVRSWPCSDGRVMLSIEGNNAVRVHLFAGRADLARLRDTIAATVADLDAAAATADSGESG